MSGLRKFSELRTLEGTGFLIFNGLKLELLSRRDRVDFFRLVKSSNLDFTSSLFSTTCFLLKEFYLYIYFIYTL